MTDELDTGLDLEIEQALRYSNVGMAIFPVHAESKAPMPGYGWPMLATSKRDEVIIDFTNALVLWGPGNVSVAWALGHDGCMAVDIDAQPEPPWVSEIEPDAMINVTRRGRHLYFKNPPELIPGNGTSHFPTQGGFDVRGAGGYVVIAGPDRPGFDAGQLAAARPYPIPAHLTPFGGHTSAATAIEVRAFEAQHQDSKGPQYLNWLTTAIETQWQPGNAGDPRTGRHPLACEWLAKVADESQLGLYPFRDGVLLVREWWRRVTPSERHGREWAGMLSWAVGRALAKANAQPTDATAEDQSAEALEGDDNTLIQFHELPDPFVIPPIEWHAKGLLMQGTHGELGGPEKSMKSYLALATTIGIALGQPVLGHFEVPERQRVLMLSGEGGEIGMLRRVERITAAYGATIADLRPWLRYTAMTAPLTSSLMLDSIRAAVEEFDPAIVWLDPWYAYAPGSAVASSALLTDIGQVLSNWRQAVGVERTAMINHHLNTGGTGDGLQRLAGAGHAEWCDSWMLVDHRERPAVDEGRFRLRLRVGSRQWGGGDYAVDMNLGRFDPEHGVHVGSIHWRVGGLAATAAETDDERHQAVMIEAQLAIKRYMRRQDRPVGRNELIEAVGGRKERIRAALTILIERGEVIERSLKVAGQTGRPKIVCSLVEDQP